MRLHLDDYANSVHLSSREYENYSTEPAPYFEFCIAAYLLRLAYACVIVVVIRVAALLLDRYLFKRYRGEIASSRTFYIRKFRKKVKRDLHSCIEIFRHFLSCAISIIIITCKFPQSWSGIVARYDRTTVILVPVPPTSPHNLPA